MGLLINNEMDLSMHACAPFFKCKVRNTPFFGNSNVKNLNSLNSTLLLLYEVNK